MSQVRLSGAFAFLSYVQIWQTSGISPNLRPWLFTMVDAGFWLWKRYR